MGRKSQSALESVAKHRGPTCKPASADWSRKLKVLLRGRESTSSKQHYRRYDHHGGALYNCIAAQAIGCGTWQHLCVACVQLPGLEKKKATRGCRWRGWREPEHIQRMYAQEWSEDTPLTYNRSSPSLSLLRTPFLHNLISAAHLAPSTSDGTATLLLRDTHMPRSRTRAHNRNVGSYASSSA